MTNGLTELLQNWSGKSVTPETAIALIYKMSRLIVHVPDYCSCATSDLFNHSENCETREKAYHELKELLEMT